MGKTPEDIIYKDVNKHVKNHSGSLAIKEIQNKTKMRYHYISTRVIKMKKYDNRCWQGCG